MKKLLQKLAILLQVFWLFFPGILFIVLGYVFFTDFLQGKDIIITGLRSRQTSFFFITGLCFWVLITWYTARLIAYNDDKLYSIAKDALYKMPRILGFSCFSVLLISFASIIYKQDFKLIQWIGILTSFISFHVFHALFEKIKNGNDRNKLIQYRRFIWIFFCLLTFIMVYYNDIAVFIPLLLIMQIGFLFIVVTRRKISETSKRKYSFINMKMLGKLQQHYHTVITWLFTDKEGFTQGSQKEVMIQREKNIFMWFSMFSLIALVMYVSAIFSLTFARIASPLPIILLSFGILLGAGNILSMLSIKLKINFHFLFIASLVIAGFFNEPHNAQMIERTKDQGNVERPNLNQYFFSWMKERNQVLHDSNQHEMPVYFVLADGGGSRSAYWTASILTKINSTSNGRFENQLFCLSGASGGSLGNMAFYSTLQNQSEDSKLTQVCEYLSNDFLSFPLSRLMGPDLLLPLFPFHGVKDRADALEASFMYVDKGKEIGEFMQQPFSSLFSSHEKTSHQPIICINSTRMQDGAPAVISNIKIKKAQFGTRVDVWDLLKPNEDLSIATAVSLGARFPYVSPAGRIQDQYFVDGGYFDNSGAGVVHEMILSLQSIINDSLRINPKHPYKKIRFHVVHISNEIPGQKIIKKVHPLVNDLAAPVKTILGSYASQTDINNLRLYKYLQEINKGANTYHKLNLYKAGDKDIFPMNWAMSDQARNGIDKRVEEIQLNY